MTLLASEAGAHAFYGWKNTIVIVWLTQATGPAVERFMELMKDATRAHPVGVSHIHLVANGAGSPTAAARTGFVNLMQHYQRNIACIAVVLQGSGFWSSTLRSVITGMRMISPRTFGMRFHENIDEVAEWLPEEHARRTGVVLPPDALTEALRQARDS